MRALVTGAAGFLGRHLVQRLAQEGETVRCFVRKREQAAALWGEGASVPKLVEVYEGDLSDRGSLLKAMDGTEVVFHLAGIRRASTQEAFFRVNAEGTRNLCEAMAERAARRLVLCSSLAACGPSTVHRPREEDDPPAPEEWYGESKLEAERIAFSYSGRFGVTAARPCRILGPGDRENLVFFRLISKGWRLEITGGPRPLSMVDVDDVARMLLLLARRQEAEGQSFFVASTETTTLEGLEDVVASTVGIRPRAIRLSPSMLRSMAFLADLLSVAWRHPLPLNRKLARQLLAPAWTCSPEKARQRLGFQTQFSISDSIKRSAAWYQQQGWI